MLLRVYSTSCKISKILTNPYRCTKKIKLWSQLFKGLLSLTRVNLESVFLFFVHKLFFPVHFDYSHLHVRAPEHQIEGKNQQECALKFGATLCQFCLKMITSNSVCHIWSWPLINMYSCKLSGKATKVTALTMWEMDPVNDPYMGERAKNLWKF